MPRYRRNRDRLKCSLFHTTWIAGIKDTIENFILKNSDVRFKSHGVWELKNFVLIAVVPKRIHLNENTMGILSSQIF